MSRYIRQFDYTKFRGMDLFFSNGRRPHNWIVRFACAAARGVQAAFRGADSRAMADHAGFVTENHGQMFVTEMSPAGMRENPFEDYRTKRCRILEVWRWKGFDDSTVRATALQEMERKRRHGKELEYDWWGAITSSWLGAKLFPNAKQDPRRAYCSEDVVDMIVRYGYIGPLPLTKNPEDVRQWVRNSKQFEPVENWELPQR